GSRQSGVFSTAEGAWVFGSAAIARTTAKTHVGYIFVARRIGVQQLSLGATDQVTIQNLSASLNEEAIQATQLLNESNANDLIYTDPTPPREITGFIQIKDPMGK